MGKPVRVLGECVYDVPGLTAQCPLDSFWRNPPAPDPLLRDAFVRAMANCIQIKGGFFSRRGLDAAVEVAAERLSQGLINQPLRAVSPQIQTHDLNSLGEQAVAAA
jgi:capsular polysaccharide export protein